MKYMLILLLIISIHRVIIGDAAEDTVSDICLTIITLPAIIMCYIPALLLLVYKGVKATPNEDDS